MFEFHLNSGARERLEGLTTRSAAIDFHRQLPGYRPTSLHSCDRLAERLGLAHLLVKEESSRFGLPAYKILGASWAIYNLLLEVTGLSTLDELRTGLADSDLTLLSATDGNHGRAVARAAGWFGLAAEIFVPADIGPVRIEALLAEGARVRRIAGSYDEAVRQAAASSGKDRLLIQDTSWPGYEQVPSWIVEGYGTILAEAEEQLAGAEPIDLVLVQIGVGSLAAATTAHFHTWERRPRLVGVEPLGADCLLRSVRAGRAVTVPGPHRSVMAGLNCGTPSAAALPLLLSGMDAFLSVPDEYAFEAMRLLAAEGIVAGESGAAGVAGLLALTEDQAVAEAVGIDRVTRALVIVTEAATDPVSYEQAVGRPPGVVRRGQYSRG